jgi:phenylalanyl-tRNA synthetase beta chain
MKISYKKLQTYFMDTLPAPEVIAEAFTFHAFEIESVEKEGDDVILDVKVLPDRACYAKSYEGIARELSTILGLKKDDGKVKIPEQSRTIDITVDQINEVLGSNITKDEVTSILSRMDIKVSPKGDILELAIPADRLDLATWRDIPEEVGRIYGYDKIEAILPRNKTFKPQVEKTFYYAEKIKNVLIKAGFSEVYTYSLVSKGVYEIEKPLAADKNYLRTNLTDGVQKSLELNARNADILGLATINIFEIGKVFAEEGEYTSLCIGVKNVKKAKGKDQAKEKVKHIRDEVLKVVEADASILCTVDDTGGLVSVGGETIGVTNNVDGIFEINLDKLVATLSDPTSYDDLHFGKAASIDYKKFSLYPFIVRDIAVFVPESVGAEDVWKSIEKGIQDAGAKDLLARYSLFDTFKKEGKTSYAYRMVFQSMEKTLTDDEANAIMDKVNGEMKGNGWEVR